MKESTVWIAPTEARKSLCAKYNITPDSLAKRLQVWINNHDAFKDIPDGVFCARGVDNHFLSTEVEEVAEDAFEARIVIRSITGALCGVPNFSADDVENVKRLYVYWSENYDEDDFLCPECGTPMQDASDENNACTYPKIEMRCPTCGYETFQSMTYEDEVAAGLCSAY